MCTLVTARFPRPSWGSARSTPSCCGSVLMRASGTSRSTRPVWTDAVEQKRVDGVMEITLAATTTPSDVAMPASLSSDLRGSGGSSTGRRRRDARLARSTSNISSEFRSRL